ncbi:hypothetical protein ANANG_G00181600 [Anguilla anguilla]|uniref:Uncharacterized protein n=1 Tax=Anguilla anguilla TaxID=7936 RepID=A0A9D3RV25_ANGAN|nr:hypothetical protein ANANG_G00181600 [Anguilla anguilla]
MTWLSFRKKSETEQEAGHRWVQASVEFSVTEIPLRYSRHRNYSRYLSPWGAESYPRGVAHRKSPRRYMANASSARRSVRDEVRERRYRIDSEGQQRIQTRAP